MSRNKIIITVLDITLKGGIERFAINLSELLVDSDNDVCILSLHKTNDFSIYKIPDNVSVKFVTNYKFKKFLYKITTFIACIKIKYFFNNPNSKYIITSQIIIFYLYFLRYSKFKQIIASEHSTFGSSSFLVKKLRAIIFKKVSTVVTQTNDGIEGFKSIGILAKKIPNPVTNFNDKNQWKSYSNIENKEFIVLTVARLDPVKQLDHFIKIAKLVNDVNPFIKFKIVGSGGELLKLNNLLNSLNISEIFEIVPATSHVNHYYHNASLYICTSKSEAFPMTIIEALSYGIPVIAYGNLIGPREIINNQFNGFLTQENDFNFISELIIRLYFDTALMKTMKSNCLNSANDYSSESVKKLFLDII